MNAHTFDRFLFAALLLAGQEFIIQGKSISMALFEGYDTWVRDTSLVIHTTTLVSVMLLQWLRDREFDIRINFFVAPLISITACMVVILASSIASITVFFVQLALYGTACLIIILEPQFQQPMHPDFWKSVFSSIVSAAKYIIALYVAGVAALRFISEGLNETPGGFTSTIFYPTMSLMLIFFFMGYWILIPAWENFVKASQEKK